MDLDFSADEVAFREEIRTWLAEHVPTERRPHGDHPDSREFDLAWQREQYDGGWAGIAWPVEYGGRGLSTIEQLIWYEEYARSEAPWIGSCFVGINHGGPTLIARASDEQKTFHLPRILRGDVVWCQGFSEPDAGSDLASLKTRAVIDGEELVVTGQKIWTSFAHLADYQELLVRTDPESSRHRGISWVICDMRLPGITVRVIPQLDRGNEFCEVFYDEVRIPLANVVGDLGDGWSVAMSTLSFERGTGFMAEIIETTRMIDDLIDEARHRTGPDGRRPLIADDEYARRLAALKAEITVTRSATYRAISRNQRTGAPGPEGSMLRLSFGDLIQTLTALAMDMLGTDAVAYVDKFRKGGWTGEFLRAFSAGMGGGTFEIQRNIIGERVLGLPRDRG
ncbi:MAG: acyl-CoA dehydrogenase family protein [Ilumatobacteraceae bacterium]